MEMPGLKLGRQLAAARTLAGLTREQLAEAANITSFTVKRLELQKTISAHRNTVASLERALTNAGVRLVNDDEPGVRLVRQAAP
jgi:transcriptional regulator with XRE-family HTH domain